MGAEIVKIEKHTTRLAVKGRAAAIVPKRAVLVGKHDITFTGFLSNHRGISHQLSGPCRLYVINMMQTASLVNDFFAPRLNQSDDLRPHLSDEYRNLIIIHFIKRRAAVNLNLLLGLAVPAVEQ